MQQVDQLQLANDSDESYSSTVRNTPMVSLRHFLSLVKKEWLWTLLGLVSFGLIGMELPLSFLLLTRAIKVN